MNNESLPYNLFLETKLKDAGLKVYLQSDDVGERYNVVARLSQGILGP